MGCEGSRSGLRRAHVARVAVPVLRTRPKSGDNGEDGLLLRPFQAWTLNVMSVTCTNPVTPPPPSMLSPSPLAGLFARQWDRVPGAALSVVPSRTTSLPAVSTCIVPWPLALPIIGSPVSPPRRPRRLTFQLLGALVLPEPPPLSACRTRVQLCAPQHRNAPRLHRFPLSAVEMRLGVISQAWPILPNPLRFFILILHITVNL